MKTYSIKPKDITRQWYVLDAAEAPLGRLSTVAAALLLGKAKPTFTPHMDGGDFVIVINAGKLVVTGSKTENKTYYRHSGYPGGLYKRTLREQMEKDSTKVIKNAIRGMLPSNKLRDGRLNRLKIYIGADHGHAPQKPQLVNIEKRGHK